MIHEPFLAPLSEEQRLFHASVLAAVARVSPPARVQALDRQKAFDDDLHRALAALGVFGVGVPEEAGGAGGGAVEQVLALEALGRTATSMGVFGVVHYMATRLLREFGSPAQQAAWLGPLARGERKAAFCLTEAGGGTDVLAAMRTRARREGGQWVLNGAKMWISGALRADVLIVLARTAEHRTRGVSMLLVPRTAPGVAVSELGTFAINSLDTCAVTFDDVRVPAEALLGGEHEGFVHVLATLNGERLNGAAVALGIGHGALAAAVDYARGRQAFGRPIGQFQAVQHRLVHAGVALQGAWLTTLQAARQHDAGEALDVGSSMAKLAASKAAAQATQVGMETLGGAGFDLELPLQRFYRDIRLYSFAPVTDDMLANLLGERWLGLPRSF
jgi:acyl-CoA dehydrogenase